MSSKAPILNNEVISSAFAKAQQDPDFGFLQIGINLGVAIVCTYENKFELKKVQSSSGDTTKDWETIANELEENSHGFYVVRDPSNPKLYVLLHWGPDLSPVKQRMVYASSRATLKGYLGQASFSADYYMSTKAECNVKKLIEQRTLHHQIDFRSDSEIEKQSASIESAPKTAQSSVMQRLPVEILQSVHDCVAKYSKGECKVVIFKLSEDKKSITGEEQKEESISAIRDLLPDDEPRYFMFWHTRVREDEKVPKAPTVRVFGYYCPDASERSLKFTYSTCKNNLIDFCTEQELNFEGKVEFTDKSEFTHEYLDYHVFPVVEAKQTFETPKPPGRKKQGRGKVKIDDDEES
ncbi:hypothetical protein RFI_17873 [Reticulomyxa filosa]|uniref:ADF-H domain-containing protein n=1 Tax=Reticulomyxa filosa TaxID=46433 RepID=X6MZ91_RETFI|nr:hypothetical protein RFI_17873 [Reticulomyxa filosa]|eukprot:ETO19355.1 hypothetical protein RFI_17873 [Reticulomyxa filosa]